MSQKSRNSDRMHVALCAVFGVAVAIVGSIGAARAADDSDTSGNWVRNIYRKFNERNGAPVTGGDYGERPPLVVPPTRDLPPPGTPSTLTRSSSWPVDRDEARRKAGGTVTAERRPAHWESSQGSSVETPAVAEPPKPVTNEPSTATKVWNKLLGRKPPPEQVVFTREPPRASLVDPPRGYQTPSPDQPYGLSNPDTTYTMGAPPLRTGKPEDEGR